MNQDTSNTPRRPKVPAPRARRLVGAMAAAGLAFLVAGLIVDARSAVPVEIVPTLRWHPARAHLASLDAVPEADLAAQPVPSTFTLRPGETLAAVLRRFELEESDVRSVVETAGELTDLRKLRSGDDYTVYRDDEMVVAVHLALRSRGRLEISRQTMGWVGEFQPYSRHTELRAVQGELTGLLETAIEDAGGDTTLAYAMADVLQWDLDFNRDLQLGDTFEVLYERVFLDQRFRGPGRVLAMTYTSGDRILSAYLYGENAYYDADGRPLQKMFLRSPMQYSRVTSGYSGRRLHPVLKTYRAHYGVDYAAPTGTPVRVTANGVVASAGWDEGGGRVVKVRHANGYLTAYLHLSGFAEGIRSGARVRQGEVIGYVGSSGLATGPHLDYRVQLSGRWMNPQSLTNDPAPPIPQEQLSEFVDWRQALDRSLRAGAAERVVVVAALSPDGIAPTALN